MSEKGILMNGAMVRAIMREVNPKTQTRRIMNPQPRMDEQGNAWQGKWNYGQNVYGKPNISNFRKPYNYGDLLYVRETWADAGQQCNDSSLGYVYRATAPEWQTWQIGFRWVPSLHMPKCAARIWLEVESVWPEVVEIISEEDAIKEGFDSKKAFLDEMVRIYGDCLKKWCWATEFKRIEVPRES